MLFETAYLWSCKKLWGRAAVARRAHNSKVAGSIPAPATNEIPVKKSATRKAQVFDAEGFGNALKIKRTIQNNYTVRDVADILDIPNSTISRVERGMPTEMKSLLLICDWLGKSICDFIIYEKTGPFPVIFAIKPKGRKNKKMINFLSNHPKNKQ